MSDTANRTIKIFPRNLTARAKVPVRGNPVVSRPESGANNSHPGLEFDTRNLDRGFFEGLLFDFQFGVGARLVEADSAWREKEKEDNRQNGKRNGHGLGSGDFFLWYVYGCFGDQPDTPVRADLYGIDGYEVLRRVHDLEPGRLLTIVVGRHPDRLKLQGAKDWLPFAQKQLKLLLERSPKGEVVQTLETFRDRSGRVQVAVLTGARADYLDENGVIDLAIAEPGALTQSLCSPWQWDFADCGCYYWAASRPDIVTDADGKSGLNFLRLRSNGDGSANRKEKPANPLLWSSWMDEERVMSQPQMITDWESLPLVIDDKEGIQTHERRDPPVGDLLDRREVAKYLKHLASVEHALCVKFLYAHYSVKRQHGADGALAKVAHEIFRIAVDEMHHFRWVNEALVLLGQKAVFSRATSLREPQGPGRPKHDRELVLEALTPDAVKRVIDIEKVSRQDAPDHVAGLYTVVLASLLHHPKRHEEYSSKVLVDLQEVVKLIIDEGHDHWQRAEQIQKLLHGRKDYLNFDGPPVRQPLESDAGKLQILGDHYYQLMLNILERAFDTAEPRGRMIEQAHRVMRNLHEVGHLLAAQGQGLLFTLPRNLSKGERLQGSVSMALGTSVPRLLATLQVSDFVPVRELAQRHATTFGELMFFLAERPGKDGS